jgi:phosphate transport system substrate-binding protein
VAGVTSPTPHDHKVTTPTPRDSSYRRPALGFEQPNDLSDLLRKVHHLKRSLRSTVTATVAVGAIFGTAATALAETKGSGASFPRLAYTTWCQDSGGLCSYTSKGSTGGINDLINGLVDFGASDAPLSDQQKADLSAKRGGSGVLYFPTLLGAVTIPVNVPGAPTNLQLRSRTIGKIFAGAITNWSDPQIKADNALSARTKGFTFPNLAITACVRQDGSGTSFVTSRFLGKASPEFKAKSTESQLPTWGAPQIVRAPGNQGVANCVATTLGAIGYVDLGDARNAGLSRNLAAVGKSEVIQVQKRVKGKLKTVSVRRLVFMVPSVTAIQRAGNIKASNIPSDLLLDMTLSKEKSAYPITTTTWVLAYDNHGAAGKSGSLAGVKSTLNYFYSSAAQDKLASLGFAALPAPLLSAAKAQLTKLK